MKNKKHGFTLVELIVVITILAILGTIAFISFQGYSKSARDSARISDLNSIKKSLELFSLQTGYYPEPSNSGPITFSGSEVWTQGTIGDSVVTQIKRLNKKPTDPLTGSEYTYSRLNTKKEIQLAATLENGSLSSVNQSYAAQPGYAHVTGNYNGMLAKVTKDDQLYIIAVPSIINGDITITTYEDALTNNTLVMNGKDNLPASYDNTTFVMNTGFDEGITNPVVYNSGNTLPSNDEEITTFINQLKATYTSSNIDSGSILGLINNEDSDSLLILGNAIVEEQLGGKVASASGNTQIDIVRKTCKEILDNNPSSISGTYTVNPGSGDMEVECDMFTDGGGWTIVSSGPGGQMSLLDSYTGVIQQSTEILFSHSSTTADVIADNNEFNVKYTIPDPSSVDMDWGDTTCSSVSYSVLKGADFTGSKYVFTHTLGVNYIGQHYYGFTQNSNCNGFGMSNIINGYVGQSLDYNQIMVNATFQDGELNMYAR